MSRGETSIAASDQDLMKCGDTRRETVAERPDSSLHIVTEPSQSNWLARANFGYCNTSKY